MRIIKCEINLVFLFFSQHICAIMSTKTDSCYKKYYCFRGRERVSPLHALEIRYFRPVHATRRSDDNRVTMAYFQSTKLAKKIWERREKKVPSLFLFCSCMFYCESIMRSKCHKFVRCRRRLTNHNVCSNRGVYVLTVLGKRSFGKKTA